MLYHYLLELESYQSKLDRDLPDLTYAKHLSLLINNIKKNLYVYYGYAYLSLVE